MKINHVQGKNKGKIMIYALSTCGWCKKTKAFLKENNIAFDCIDVDLLDNEERDKVVAEIKKWNPRVSFPTIVINDDKCIAGFDEDKLNELVK
ncbi:MAG: glutaredoxin family protein [Candidatus Latescibacteria bacterium]|nr:glutaredoxin family protein [Candidatus Latescibacterota bacterium]